MFPGPYSYGLTQPLYTSEHTYHQLISSNSNGFVENFVDGYYVRDYNGYGGYGGYGAHGDYMTPNLPLPQPELRQRTPTPPPPPAEPSEEYLAASLSAQPTNIPVGQRKLVVFDLNGTLLLRSPRGFGQRKIYPRPYAHALVAYLAHPAVFAWLDCMVWSSAQAHNVAEMVDRVFGAGEGAGSGPILRAVWARDTLGLGREAFYRKTQTTKDLAKPWAFFAAPKSDASSPSSSVRIIPAALRYSPSAPPPRALSPPPTPPSLSDAPQPLQGSDDSAPAPAPPESIPERPSYHHGPYTTLLVDDSPLKVRLQPWNHLCVGEYDAVTRARDLVAAGLPPNAQSSNKTGPAATHHTNNTNGNAMDAEGAGEDVNGSTVVQAQEDGTAAGEAVEVSQHAHEPANGKTNGKGTRGKYRKALDAELAGLAEEESRAQAQAEDSGAALEGLSTTQPSSRSHGKGASGQVQVQNQSKRSKRRERKRQQKAEAEAIEEGSADGASAVPPGDEPAFPSESGSSDVSPILPTAVALVVEPLPLASDSNDAQLDDGIETKPNEDAELAPPPSSPPGDGGKKRKRDAEAETQTTVEEQTAAPECADGEPYDPTLLAVIGVLAHVRTVGNVAAWVRSGGLAAVVQEVALKVRTDDAQVEGAQDSAGVGSDLPLASGLEPTDPVQWFTSRRLLVAWAARGRVALAELEIDAAPGVESVNR
ncbi:FCP1-like proteiny domain-containing protein [Mycena sanguinolenta]|uniref:FCP1-like proteiny domain-containing protein n=1 Tax=Mycena sanguinolenta TaxID=230812 RepID=A0A8H7DKI7_9AGAR|nr:FCP1-like proteiny domain-containing protein [Mycena sanguinolenta]